MLSAIRGWVGQFAVGRVGMGLRALLHPSVAGVSAILVDAEGKVALVEHSYMNGWMLPGGGCARGEAPIDTVIRELREELGDVRSDPPEFFAIYTRPAGWATNLIVLYRLMNANVDFRPSLEVRRLIFVDPAAPPPGTSIGTRRRLAEFVGKRPLSPYW